jgi:hypothetical protein
MRIIFCLVLALSSLTASAGDQYMNCTFGPMATADGLAGTALLSTTNKALVTINQDLRTYVATYDSGTYRVIVTEANLGGYTEIVGITGTGPFQEAQLIEDLYCHIND